MAKRFERSLEKATSGTLLEPDWEGVLGCVDALRSGEAPLGPAVLAIRKRVHNANPHVASYALLVLEAAMKNCGQRLHQELATKDVMEDLKHLAADQQADKIVRDKVLALLACWAQAFRDQAHFKVVVDTVNLMKLEGFEFPAVGETEAMFLAESAPEWADGPSCFRCRADFGLLTRKHHCRNCGQIFCASCSSKQLLLPHIGIEKEVRVCDACHLKLAPSPEQIAAQRAARKKASKAARKAEAARRREFAKHGPPLEDLGYENIVIENGRMRPRHSRSHRPANPRPLPRLLSHPQHQVEENLYEAVPGFTAGHYDDDDGDDAEDVFDPYSAAGVERTRENRSSGGGTGGGPSKEGGAGLSEEEKKRRVDEARKREEEELQLALAISQSEAEENERQKQAQILRMYASRPEDEAKPAPVSYKGTQPAHAPEPAPASNGQEEENPDLARYLNRGYWEQKQREGQKAAATGRKSPAPSAPPTVESPPPATNGHGPVNGEARLETAVPLGTAASEADTRRFTEDLKAKVDVFVNRIRSNQARGRSIVHDSGINNLFVELTRHHADVLNRLHSAEDRRSGLEGLQDKAAHIGEARAALTALREETQRSRQAQAQEEQRRRQAQMTHQLQTMRLQKHEMIERQRLNTLAQMQNHQTELALRRHYQAHGVPQPPPGTPIVYVPDQNGQIVPTFATHAPAQAPTQAPQAAYQSSPQAAPAQAQPTPDPGQYQHHYAQPSPAYAPQQTGPTQAPSAQPPYQQPQPPAYQAQPPQAPQPQPQAQPHTPQHHYAPPPQQAYAQPPPQTQNYAQANPAPQAQQYAAPPPQPPQAPVPVPAPATAAEPPVDNLINFD